MLKLSVVLATYNRADTLKTTLDHLAAQDLDPSEFEVIVVDDGSTDATPEVVALKGQGFPVPLINLRHENRGPGYTQNRGIRQARAPLVLLIADDIWLAPGSLRAHIEAHERRPFAGVAILGKVLQSPELAHRGVFLKHWDPFGLAELEGMDELPALMFWVCNLSVQRDFLLKHGLFHEKIARAGPHQHHDAELGYRLSLYGLRIFYEEKAWGWHYHPNTFAQAVEMYYQRGLNWAPFRQLAPAPEVPVFYHVLNLRTLWDHVRVLRSSNQLIGRERLLSWHLARALLRSILFNRLSVPWFWEPFLERTESSPTHARLLQPRLFRMWLHYHFERGIRDARTRFANDPDFLNSDPVSSIAKSHSSAA